MSDDPEVWHLIGMPSGGMHGQLKLTANEADGRIHRQDGREPWEPMHDDQGVPVWFRVSPAIAEEWTAEDGDPDRQAVVSTVVDAFASHGPNANPTWLTLAEHVADALIRADLIVPG